MRRDLGLDQPVPVQFVIWLERLLVGNLGNSIAQQRPVLEMLVSGFGVTASLVIPAVLIASLLAIPLGMLAAWKQNTRRGRGGGDGCRSSSCRSPASGWA